MSHETFFVVVRHHVLAGKAVGTQKDFLQETWVDLGGSSKVRFKEFNGKFYEQLKDTHFSSLTIQSKSDYNLH